MAKSKSPSSLIFKVNRFAPELVVPAKPTPYEFKLLSEIDDNLRMHVCTLFIYPHNPLMNGVDLVKLMKNAISRILVYYYPLAGRLREDSSGKLVVECNGEGVLFIEANADVTLDQFGYPLAPPFLFYNQLIDGDSGSSDILNSPLFVIQMTRLKCGGITVGTRLNHCMCDASGQIQFTCAIAEITKGATSLSFLPTWERHIFNSNKNRQQRATVLENINNYQFDSKDLCYRTFFFGKTEISALRRNIARRSQRCTLFEILMSCVWKSRVLALASHPSENEIVILNWPIDLRRKSNYFKVPAGYYGNALMYAVVKSSEKDIIRNPLAYTLKLVTKGKEIVTEDIYRSVISLGTNMKNYTMTDTRNLGFGEVDFGWGKPAYGGPCRCAANIGYPMPFSHKNGDKGLMVPICLPTKSMEIFEQELDNIFQSLKFSGGDHNVDISKL